MQACPLSQVSCGQDVLWRLEKNLKATKSTASFFGKCVALNIAHTYIAFCRIEGVVTGTAGALVGAVAGAVGGGAIKLVQHCRGREIKPLADYAVQASRIGYKLCRLPGLIDATFFSIVTAPVLLPFVALFSAANAGFSAVFVFSDYCLDYPGVGSGVDQELLASRGDFSKQISEIENLFLYGEVPSFQ